MPEIAAKVNVDASPERLWEVLSDFGGVANASPTIASSRLTSEITAGVGATRHCDLTVGKATTKERVTRWDIGTGLDVEIFDGTMLPFRRAEAKFRIEPDGGASALTGTIVYEMKFGVVGKVMDKLMVRRQWTRNWKDTLAGFKHLAETGTPVDGDTNLGGAAVIVNAG
jgi:ribosome-associated toxin RatA of RatAB toxin-antitoxin module